MRRLLFACATVAACASSAAAQKLRDQLGSLLTFGDWGVPLRVGTIGPDGTIVPNDAFRASAANAEFGSFLVNWMTASASSTPLASTGGGRVFRFAGGVPVEDQPAPGPIFGERATTLGRGAVLAGVNYTGVQFSRVRGVPLDAVRLTLTQNGAAASTADAINVALSLDYQMAVTALFATVGVFDRLDVGVVVPFVRSRLTGESTANVVAGSASASASSVVLGGTAAAPVTTSRQNISGRASGIGDVALRAKLNLVDRPTGGVGLVTDLRFPTGDADNLLGSGTFSARALAVYSGRFGALVPYANAGYVYYADSTINNALLATVGADVDMARWATVSLSVLGQRHAGASAYRLPAGQEGRSLTNIPEIRDDALSIAFGTKLAVRNNRLTLNVLAPFTRGGPRPDFAYTVGLERAF